MKLINLVVVVAISGLIGLTVQLVRSAFERNRTSDG